MFVEISPLALQENVNACFTEGTRNRYLDFGSGTVSVLVIFLGRATFGECQLNVSLWTKQSTHQPLDNNAWKIQIPISVVGILKIYCIKMQSAGSSKYIQHLPASMRRDFLQRRLLRSNPCRICQTCIRNHLHFHRHPTILLFYFVCTYEYFLNSFSLKVSLQVTFF